MEDVLKEITIGSEIRDALLGMRNMLRDVFDVVFFYERGEWDEFEKSVARGQVPTGIVSDLYVRSMEWAAAMLAGEEVPDNAPV